MDFVDNAKSMPKPVKYLFVKCKIIKFHYISEDFHKEFAFQQIQTT